MRNLLIKSKAFRFFTAFFILIILFAGQSISAKMVGLEPKEMVENSDLIILGTVINKSVNGDYVNSKVSVDRILKGKTTKQSIDIMTPLHPQMDTVTYGFPDKGNMVMLFFYKGQLNADFNNIAVVKSNKVKLFNGIGYGRNDRHWNISDYEKEYDKLLPDNQWNYIAILIAAVILIILLFVLTSVIYINHNAIYNFFKINIIKKPEEKPPVM